jgi:anti-sigma regulatory factor (Ser/Thr protein kinase)
MHVMEWNFRSKSMRDARTSRAEFMRALRSDANAKSDLGAAELIFGELIGNVVQHAPGPVRVRLDWSGKKAVLSVHDEHAPFTPRFELPADPLQEHGRGLYIARALATSFDVTHISGDGTKVTVGLPVWR